MTGTVNKPEEVPLPESPVVEDVVDALPEGSVEAPEPVDDSVVPEVSETPPVPPPTPESKPEIVVTNSDDTVVRIVSQLKAMHGDLVDFNMSKLPQLIIKTMELVENVKGLTGYQKKDLVTKCVHVVVDESDMAGIFEELVLPMIPKMVDEIIMVDAGKMKINNNLKKRFSKMFFAMGKLFSGCKCKPKKECC